MSKEKTIASGTMTPAMFVTFIKGHLRKASRWWKPISDTLKEARVTRGWYLCNGCKENVPNSTVVNGKRTKNVFVDHINPVVDPLKGFTTWDDFINRLFTEKENLQLLCSSCHDAKTKDERLLSKNKKELDE